MIDLTKTIDLSTTYLGLKLKNPLVASSSPMCADVGKHPPHGGRRRRRGGARFAVRGQIELESTDLDRFLSASSEISAESTTQLPELTHGWWGGDLPGAHPEV